VIDLVTGAFLVSVLLIAIIHTLGEVIYKKGTMPFVEPKGVSQTSPSSLRTLSIPIIIIGVSFGISFGVKIIYGIILGLNPLSSTAALFLGSVAIFSVIFGKIFFNEQISPYQLFGIVLIALGIMMVV
jgi:drug/metabolite transporter (DMT)-like permease